MIFRFVVQHLKWLVRVPLAPQLFDSFLLMVTAVFARERFRAIEAFEARALKLAGVSPCRHRFGGAGFVYAGREVAHLHGNGLLDVHLTAARSGAAVRSGRALPHHVLGHSSWVSFWVSARADVDSGIALLEEAMLLSRGSV